MKKSEMMDALVKETGLTKKDVEAVFNGTFDLFKKELKKGNNVAVAGFGTFKISNFNQYGKYYLYTLKYIRRNIRKRELQKMLEKHLEHSDYEINEVIDGCIEADAEFKKCIKKNMKKKNLQKD